LLYFVYLTIKNVNYELEHGDADEFLVEEQSNEEDKRIMVGILTHLVFPFNGISFEEGIGNDNNNICFQPFLLSNT